MKILKILFSLSLSMIIVFVQAWAFSTLWSWFVAPQYGSGPTYPAWFGLSLIAGTVIGTVLVRSDISRREKDDDDDDLSRGILVGVGIILAYFFVVGWSWVVGQIAGWL